MRQKKKLRVVPMGKGGRQGCNDDLMIEPGCNSCNAMANLLIKQLASIICVKYYKS
jgi:hypothetical protein